MTPPRREPRSRAARRFAAAAATAWLGLTLAGCFGGPKNFENENDRLRAEVLELEREVDRLSDALDRRLGEIKSLRAKLDVPEGVDPPILSRVALGRYTAPVDEDDDGRDDAIVAYLRTLDQHGRFLPVAAEATLAIAVIDADDDQAAILARRAFDREALDEAYRTGLTGTHYTLRLPLPAAGEADLPEEVTLRVEVRPAEFDTEFTAQRPMRLQTGD